MLKLGSRTNLEGEFQCKISLLDDTELSCDFKVRIVLISVRNDELTHMNFTDLCCFFQRPG